MSVRELVLKFDRDLWRACGEGVDLAHRELRGLEALVEARLAGEAPVDVELKFHMAALPRWLHQYHAYAVAWLFHRGIVPPLAAP
jgi:hypothetical protein